MSTDLELPDDADRRDQQLIFAALVKARRGGVDDVIAMLRRTPHYDRDHAALLRAARRIEEWAGP